MFFSVTLLWCWNVVASVMKIMGCSATFLYPFSPELFLHEIFVLFVLFLFFFFFFSPDRHKHVNLSDESHFWNRFASFSVKQPWKTCTKSASKCGHTGPFTTLLLVHLQVKGSLLTFSPYQKCSVPLHFTSVCLSSPTSNGKSEGSV